MIWDIRPLLTFSFWFNTTPPPLLPFFERMFFILYILALVVTLVLGFFERKTKQIVQKTFIGKLRRCFTTLGITGLVLTFFVYERTPYLSMRFFTLLLWVGLGVWVILILMWRFRTAPRLQKVIDERKGFEKYLPK